MNEMISIWLEEMYKNELKEVEGNISNEMVWAKGSTGEDREMHEENLLTLFQYREVLENLLEEVNDEY